MTVSTHQTTLFGTHAEVTDQGKVSKRQSLSQSRPRHPGQRGLVLAAIAAAGVKGVTRHEISRSLRVPLSSICGRVKELKDASPPMVYDTERRREGRAVIVCKEFLADTIEVRPAFQPDTSPTPMKEPTMPETMPDQLTCNTVPNDDRGDPMRSDRTYRINGKFVQCFEDERGMLMIQECHRIGVAKIGSTPQLVGELPPNVFPVRSTC